MQCFSVGNLVYHESKNPFIDSYRYGIIVESWLDQKKFDNVPEHNSDEIVVCFPHGLKIINIRDVKVF